MPESAFRFDQFDHPEFDQWRWVDYWYPVNHVIYFKRNIYKRALRELDRFRLIDSDTATGSTAQGS